MSSIGASPATISISESRGNKKYKDQPATDGIQIGDTDSECNERAVGKSHPLSESILEASKTLEVEEAIYFRFKDNKEKVIAELVRLGEGST
ncbi:hypothetical protein V6N13_110578 [Hibiscus sabdariffa]